MANEQEPDEMERKKKMKRHSLRRGAQSGNRQNVAEQMRREETKAKGEIRREETKYGTDVAGWGR